MKNRLSLGFFPTPLHKLERLSGIYKPYEIYIKRDDQTGLASGGNKTRKLEYLLAEAIDFGYNAIVTTGAQQSNHCRQTAAACAVAGLECHLVLRGDEPGAPNGNLLLSRLLGAHIYFAGNTPPDEVMTEVSKKIRLDGRDPYIIPVGGSNKTGMRGYVDAIGELKLQQKAFGVNFDYVFFATSSGGTQAGMLLGKWKYGLNTKLMPVCVEKDDKTGPSLEEKVLSMCYEGCIREGLEKLYNPQDVGLIKEYGEAGYGVMTEGEKMAINELAKTEGILLDPVYTARAFFAMTDMMRQNLLEPKSKILFWHTGGLPAIFHYAEQLGKPRIDRFF